MAGLNAFYFSLARLEERQMDIVSLYDIHGNLKKNTPFLVLSLRRPACNILFYFRVFKLEPPDAA